MKRIGFAVAAATLMAGCIDETTTPKPSGPTEPSTEYHMVSASYELTVDTDYSALIAGFFWPDLGEIDSEASTVSASNACTISASYIFDTASSFPRAQMKDQGCEASMTFNLDNTDGLALVAPGYSDAEETSQDVVIPLDLAAYESAENAYSASVVDLDTAFTDGTATRGFSSVFIAKKDTDASFADMAGDWAFTRLEIESVPSEDMLFTVLNFPATLDATGTISVDETAAQIESEFLVTEAFLEPQKRRFETTSEAFSFDYQLSSDGSMSINFGDRPDQAGRSPQVAEGFAAPSSDFFVLTEGAPSVGKERAGDEQTADLTSFGGHQLFMGIKRTNTPSLAGKSYKVVGMYVEVFLGSHDLIQFTDTASLTFNADATSVNVAFHGSRDNSLHTNLFSSGVVTSNVANNWALPVSMGPDGRIDIDFSGVNDADQALVNGYASTNSEVLLFAHGVSRNTATIGEIGMWMAFCTNCDE